MRPWHNRETLEEVKEEIEERKAAKRSKGKSGEKYGEADEHELVKVGGEDDWK